MLSKEQINQFIEKGYVRIDHAFSKQLAAEVRKRLWQDIPADPGDPATWKEPVVRLGMYSGPAFTESANTPVLHEAFDQLAGKGRWQPCMSMGTFPVRFPSDTDPGDTGWHVDAGFPGSDPADYFGWRINKHSTGRALLMLFLFSDTGAQDAPTLLRERSHIDVARMLKHEGEQGLSFMELAMRLHELPDRTEIMATGEAGTVYLCHPFMVHAAQPHRGKEPRFLAQPPLLYASASVSHSHEPTPVEKAIGIG